LNSLTDTHCHLYLPHFDRDREKVIKFAIDCGIRKILIPGIDIKTSEQALNLCAIYPNVLYAAVGIHPNSKNDFCEKSIGVLKSLAQSNHVIAIGEIGLDYYRLGNSIEQQKMMLQSQLDLAAELNLPVCIHNRDASEDVIQLIEKWLTFYRESKRQSIPTGVFHSFNGNIFNANKIISLGFYLGINGPITYSSNHELRDVIKKVSIEKILIETDAPFLPPHPFRGQRNLPLYVKYIAHQLANLYQIELEVVENITSINAENLFNWQ
jgi:TatD DNase family protein